MVRERRVTVTHPSTTTSEQFTESPYARAVVAAADLWSGEQSLPTIEQSEYMRGMVETLATALAPQEGNDGDQIKGSVYSDITRAWQTQEHAAKIKAAPLVQWHAGIVAIQTRGTTYFAVDGASAVILADADDDSHDARAYYVDARGEIDTAPVTWNLNQRDA